MEYKGIQNEEDFRQGLDELSEIGFAPQRERIRISIPDAREQLLAGLRYYMGENAVWLPAYDDVAAWLTDNRGRGLLCVGGNGLGKTMLCQYIIPVILYKNMGLVVTCSTAMQMVREPDSLLTRRLLSIDDIGVEPLETVSHGTRRIAFSEIVDASERIGSLLILSTNLRTSAATDASGVAIPSIQDRYGLRTYDRLRGAVKSVVFTGKSMRR